MIIVKKQNIKKPIIQTIHGVLEDEYIQAIKRKENSTKPGRKKKEEIRLCTEYKQVGVAILERS